MILCLDVGNSHIVGGVYQQKKRRLHFRHSAKIGDTSDQIGIFLRQILIENQLSTKDISQIALCSVAPQLDYSIRAACIKYLNLDPFILKPGVKTGLKIKYHNPQEVGADCIAASIAAIHGFPGQNIIIVDFGLTATTIYAISSAKEYLGSVIMPGLKLCMQALNHHTAKLIPVEILRPNSACGSSTITGIQAGLYYQQLGAVQYLLNQIQNQYFKHNTPLYLTTGGFAYLFQETNLSTELIPDLTLLGLKIALQKNQ